MTEFNLRLAAQVLLVILLLLDFVLLYGKARMGKPAQEPTGWRGIVQAVIVVALTAFLLWLCGAFSEFVKYDT